MIKLPQISFCRVCCRVAQRTILDSRCVRTKVHNAPYQMKGFWTCVYTVALQGRGMETGFPDPVTSQN